MTKQKGWLESNLEDQEFQRLLAREDFIEDFLNEIDRLMTEKRMTRAELARRMDCRPSHVTQLFRRTRNLTAASMVDLAFHLGVRLRVVVERGLQRERPAGDWTWNKAAVVSLKAGERVVQPLVRIKYPECAAGTGWSEELSAPVALAS